MEISDTKLTFNAEPSIDGKVVMITCHLADGVRKDFYQKVMNTEERVVREGLIALGWTPPAAHPESPLLDPLVRLLRQCERYLGPMLAGGDMTKARRAICVTLGGEPSEANNGDYTDNLIKAAGIGL